jgi:hypothetical protein
MSICKRIFWLLACVVVTTQASAQVTHSPFSRFGVGENYGSALANTQGMAGIGVSQPQIWYVNNQNPALLVFNSLATFQVGLIGETKTVSSSSASEKYKGGNMNYLVTAFPVKPGKWTTSLGLMPYSSVKYDFKYISGIDGKPGTTATAAESGSGGLTQLFWSNGVRLAPDFSIGLKASYIFGSIDKIYKSTPNVAGALTSGVEGKNFVKDFNFSVGGSYSKDSIWGNEYRLSIGAVYGFGADLRSKISNKYPLLTTRGDTLAYTRAPGIKGTLHLPPSLTGGLSFGKNNKWFIATEFNYQDWSGFSDPDPNNDDRSLKESWRAAFGGEFTPDPFASEGFIKRITYRVGISQEQLPYLINNNTVTDRGINFGFSLPAGRSSLDLAFKLGKRGNKTMTTLEENYFRVFLGITFNDQWFIKRKFD